MDNSYVNVFGLVRAVNLGFFLDLYSCSLGFRVKTLPKFVGDPRMQEPDELLAPDSVQRISLVGLLHSSQAIVETHTDEDRPLVRTCLPGERLAIRFDGHFVSYT